MSRYAGSPIWSVMDGPWTLRRAQRRRAGSDPVTPSLWAKGKSGDPFPYNLVKAKSLLAGHGRKRVPGCDVDTRKAGHGGRWLRRCRSS